MNNEIKNDDNNLDEIEVNVVEEEIIEENDFETIDEDKFYEATKFDSLVEELKEELRRNNFDYSPAATSIAKELVQHPKEDLDNNSYIWIMFALHKNYKHNKDANGNTYASMRARDIIDMSTGKSKQSVALDFNEITVDQKLIDIIKVRTKFLDEAMVQIKEKMLKYGIFLSVIVLILPLIFNSFSFGLAGIELLILWFVLLFVMLPKTKRKFIQIQSRSLLRHLDNDIISFDTPILMSNLGK
ncbi:MAG: hypothetical protein RR646_05600 [Erysipelotrichaceae bacterium]